MAYAGAPAAGREGWAARSSRGAHWRLCLGSWAAQSGLAGACPGPRPWRSFVVVWAFRPGCLIRARWAQDFQFMPLNEVRARSGWSWPRWSWRCSRRDVRSAGKLWRRRAAPPGGPCRCLRRDRPRGQRIRAGAQGSLGARGFSPARWWRSASAASTSTTMATRAFFGRPADCRRQRPGRNPGAQDWPDGRHRSGLRRQGRHRRVAALAALASRTRLGPG